MSEVREHIVVTVLRVCLGVFLIFVGGEKFFRLGDFYEDILNYELVGGSFAEMLAFMFVDWKFLVAVLRGRQMRKRITLWESESMYSY